MPINLKDIDTALQALQGLREGDVAQQQRRTLTAEYASFLPGFEALQALPQSTREEAVARIPGLARTGAALGIGAGATAAGGALGGLTSPVTGAAGPILGGTLGSLVGRKANVALGLEEPGVVGDVLSVAPGAAQMGALGAKALLPRVPGVAPALHEMAIERLGKVPGALRPDKAAAPLYAALEAQNPPITLSPAASVAHDIIARESALPKTAQNAMVLRLARELEAMEQAGPVPFTVAHDVMKRLGEMVGEAVRSARPDTGQLKQLYGAMYESMDKAGLPLLREANAITRKNLAVDDLSTMFAEGAPGLRTRPDGLVQVNGGMILDRFAKLVKNDKLFRESFTGTEREAIKGVIEDTLVLPRMTAPKGASFGSGGVIGRGSVVGSVTTALTGDPGLGVTLGMAQMALEYALPRLLITKPGRALVQSVLHGKGGLGGLEAQILLQAARAMGGEEPVPE